eukprot:scaffold4743_cov171-Amphora_coffeaeformis.AAC.15
MYMRWIDGSYGMSNIATGTLLPRACSQVHHRLGIHPLRVGPTGHYGLPSHFHDHANVDVDYILVTL